MPELFHCDMDEFYETCEIFSDSADLNGILVVSDEAEPNIFQFYFCGSPGHAPDRHLPHQGGSHFKDLPQLLKGVWTT